MIVRDLIKALLDQPLDAEVVLRVYTSDDHGQRTEFDVARVTPIGQNGRYVAIEDAD